MVAGGRPGARLVAAPGRLVAVAELGRPARVVGVVAEREDRPRDVVQQQGRGLVLLDVARGDVTGADEDGVVGGTTSDG